MKDFFKIIVVIIIAIITFLMTGCSSNLKVIETTQKEINVFLPEDPSPLILDLNTNYIVVNSMFCLNTEDYKIETYNLREIERYIEQLKNNNKALKSIINELKKWDENGKKHNMEGVQNN